MGRSGLQAVCTPQAGRHSVLFTAMNPLPSFPRLVATLSGAGSGTGPLSRRAQPRNVLRCPVTIAIAGGPERSGTTVDLSPDGLSLSTDKPISPGSRCTLSLHPPQPDLPQTVQLEVKSVYSSYTAPGDFRIGMVFTQHDPQIADWLRALAAQLEG
jgi:hypothetical protein